MNFIVRGLRRTKRPIWFLEASSSFLALGSSGSHTSLRTQILDPQLPHGLDEESVAQKRSLYHINFNKNQ